MAAKYSIVYTRPTMYLDKLSQPINGFEIAFEIKTGGEQHKIYVSKMDAVLIDSEILKFIAEREKLDSMTK